MNASLVRVCSGVSGGRTFGHLAGCTVYIDPLYLGDRDRESLQQMKIRPAQSEPRMLGIA